MCLAAEMEILMLKPEPPGKIVNQSGDIDNQLKTLLDALRMPSSTSELPRGESPKQGENPFFCLLEDDRLITKLSVTTDQLLTPVKTRNHVSLVICVKTRYTHEGYVMRSVYL